MRVLPSTLTITLLAGSVLIVGCTSKDQVAAAAAAQADGEFQQGRYSAAKRSIRTALNAHDDVSEYWLLLARIDIAQQDYGGAYEAYQNVLQSDRGNVEALRQLAQLGLSVRQPDKVDQYSDQLLLLNPQDPMPLVMKGGAALQRADTVKALDFAERVLATDPHNISALILKGQVLAYKGDYKGATALIETSLNAGNDQTSQLTFLRDTYAKTGNVEGYGRAVLKLARAHADDAGMQLTLADLLYQTDHPAEGLNVLRQIMQRRPKDIGLAASILNLWLEQGADALSTTDMLAAKSLPLEMRAAVAQFANETGRPAIALQILGDGLSSADPNPENSDAKASVAFALGLNGRGRDALAQLQQILDVDSAQPRALLARARLRAVTGNLLGAVSDARQVVADDPINITARLVLSDILLQQHEGVLAESALREAVRAMPTAVRPVARLANLLTQTGRRDDIPSILQTLARAAPTSVRAQRLLARYHVAMPSPATT